MRAFSERRGGSPRHWRLAVSRTCALAADKRVLLVCRWRGCAPGGRLSPHRRARPTLPPPRRRAPLAGVDVDAAGARGVEGGGPDGLDGHSVQGHHGDVVALEADRLRASERVVRGAGGIVSVGGCAGGRDGAAAAGKVQAARWAGTTAAGASGAARRAWHARLAAEARPPSRHRQPRS